MRRWVAALAAVAVVGLGGCADAAEDAVAPQFHREMETASVGDLVEEAGSAIQSAAPGSSPSRSEEPRDPADLVARIDGCRLVDAARTTEPDTRQAACTFDNGESGAATDVEVRTYSGRQPESVVPRPTPGRSVIAGPDFVLTVEAPHPADRPVDVTTIARQVEGEIVTE